MYLHIHNCEFDQEVKLSCLNRQIVLFNRGDMGVLHVYMYNPHKTINMNRIVTHLNITGTEMYGQGLGVFCCLLGDDSYKPCSYINSF